MDNSKISNIYNYEFDWYQPKKCNSKCETKEKCCKKFKKKKEKYCKTCPKLVA